jgi:hypothetical protein
VPVKHAMRDTPRRSLATPPPAAAEAASAAADDGVALA